MRITRGLSGLYTGTIFLKNKHFFLNGKMHQSASETDTAQRWVEGPDIRSN